MGIGPERRPRVLIVEADPDYRSVMAHTAELAGCEPVVQPDLARALTGTDGEGCDVVVLGVDPAARPSPATLAQLRDTARAPVILLDESYEEARASFEAGVDQILPKPFVPGALIGAIRSELRTANPTSIFSLAQRIELEGVTFDAARRRIVVGERAVTMTRREWELLTFLLSRVNQYTRAEDLVAGAWGDDVSVEQLRSYITRLRRKFKALEPPFCLLSQPGFGYCLSLEGLTA
ncbi:MAG TPA: response regulator transcription factor [Candidatus Dormibacteraeota bacterium]|nr:response regulator transcription factor [Candidatus Dormibacteraeota bacterium]